MRKKKLYILGAVFLALWLLFIFGQSVLSNESSHEESIQLLSVINRWFPSMTDTVIRKLAHYFEFLVLGIFLSVIPVKRLSTKVLIALLCALSDETIQIFVLGRGSQLRDVLIDFVGTLTAILPIFLIRKYWNHEKEK